ncbi:MAG TPA: PD-(D/E)XK nuclease family protein, partial [Candidatus Binatus sp.]|nr:PD-(D/E)XK nuclease family protein [Candidatus Binatus sp.]
AIDLDAAPDAEIRRHLDARPEALVLLEGKGDPRYLREGKGDAFAWCHQVWDVLGRDRVAAFGDALEPERLVELADGGAVRLERAGRYLARAGAEPPMPEPRVEAAGAVESAQVARVLEFVPAPPAEIVTSPTALADFRRCPRQYWYRQVLGLPERGAGGGRATLLGTAAHGVLEAIDLDAAPDAEIRRHLDARPEALVLRPAERDALAADLGAAAAALRADVVAGFAIAGREVPFVLGLPRRNPRLFLHGRIDILGRRGAAHVIRDYKYARAGPASVENHAPQLAAYRLAVLAAGATSADAELVFLRGGTVVRPLPLLDAAAEEAALVRAGAQLGTSLATGTIAAFPRTPAEPALCEALGCGYVRRCWGGAVTAHS